MLRPIQRCTHAAAVQIEPDVVANDRRQVFRLIAFFRLARVRRRLLQRQSFGIADALLELWVCSPERLGGLVLDLLVKYFQSIRHLLAVVTGVDQHCGSTPIRIALQIPAVPVCGGYNENLAGFSSYHDRNSEQSAANTGRGRCCRQDIYADVLLPDASVSR